MGFFMNMTGCEQTNGYTGIANPCYELWTLVPSLSDALTCGYYTPKGKSCGTRQPPGPGCPKIALVQDFVNTAPSFPIYTMSDGTFTLYSYTYLDPIGTPTAIVGLAACAPPFYNFGAHPYAFETTLYSSTQFTQSSPFPWVTQVQGWTVNPNVNGYQPANTNMGFVDAPMKPHMTYITYMPPPPNAPDSPPVPESAPSTQEPDGSAAK